jgi:quinol monooxygenase YgiN
MELAPEKHGETIHLLCSIAKRTRSMPGCIGCGVYRSIENESVVLVEQFWNSHEDMLYHLRSEDYQKLLLVIEMAMNKPEIQFNSIMSTTGVETIQKARLGKKAKCSRSVN